MRVIWFSSVFLLMGNLSSANATIYAMAADSCPPSQRSRYFYYLYSTFLVCELFAPALASMTIERHLIIPFAVGFACLFTCFPILGLMPETHHQSRPDRPRLPRRASKDEDETSPLLFSPSPSPALEAAAECRSPRTAPDGTTHRRKSLVSVLKNRNILLALFVLFAGALRQGTVSVLLQYAAVRFGWPTSQTAMLVSAIAASNIVLFLVILPQTVAFLTSRWHIIPQIIDYNVVSASLVVLTTGSVLMGLASSMTGLIFCESLRPVLFTPLSSWPFYLPLAQHDCCIPRELTNPIVAVLFFATGYGTRVAVLSLVTAWTDEDTRASTFGFAQIVEGIGRMCGDPILLRIFARSMTMEGTMMGLPFFVAAVRFTWFSGSWLSSRGRREPKVMGGRCSVC